MKNYVRITLKIMPLMLLVAILVSCEKDDQNEVLPSDIDPNSETQVIAKSQQDFRVYRIFPQTSDGYKAMKTYRDDHFSDNAYILQVFNLTDQAISVSDERRGIRPTFSTKLEPGMTMIMSTSKKESYFNLRPYSNKSDQTWDGHFREIDITIDDDGVTKEIKGSLENLGGILDGPPLFASSKNNSKINEAFDYLYANRRIAFTPYVQGNNIGGDIYFFTRD